MLEHIQALFWRDRLSLAGIEKDARILVSLLTDPHAEVRVAAACNPSTPQKAVECALIEYDEARVIAAILRSKRKLSGQCLQDLWIANEHSHAVLIAICEHPSILPDMAFRIARSKDATSSMIKALLENVNVPEVVKASAKEHI